MFRVLLSTLIISFFILTEALAAPDNIFNQLQIGPGKLTVTSTATDLCTGGPFQLIGAKGEEVLMVGSTISLPLPSEKKIIDISPSESACAEEHQSQLVKNELQVVTTVYSCPPKLKHLESSVKEVLSSSHQIIKYVRTSKDQKPVECLFQWRIR